MPTIQNICDYLDEFAPTRLAEEWDNVGLLTGDAAAVADRVMTCLTVTPESAAEAIERNASLIVSHHPLPFRPLKRLTTDATPSRLVWELARANVAIYSPHTGFDSALEGINELLAAKLGLQSVKPLKPLPDDPQQLGAGRVGTLGSPLDLTAFSAKVKSGFGKTHLATVGERKQTIRKVAVACGSGGSFLPTAIFKGCDALVTGEATFHTCLEAKAAGVALLLLGHYESERFAVERLADRLGQQFAGADVWASEKESNPIEWQ